MKLSDRICRSSKKRPNRVKFNLNDIFCAGLYALKSARQWRMLPSDYPKWGAVYSYFRQWNQKPALPPEKRKVRSVNIEVGQPVTRLPPHRSLRAELPHKALQSCSLRTQHFFYAALLSSTVRFAHIIQICMSGMCFLCGLHNFVHPFPM